MLDGDDSRDGTEEEDRPSSGGPGPGQGTRAKAAPYGDPAQDYFEDAREGESVQDYLFRIYKETPEGHKGRMVEERARVLDASPRGILAKIQKMANEGDKPLARREAPTPASTEAGGEAVADGADPLRRLLRLVTLDDFRGFALAHGLHEEVIAYALGQRRGQPEGPDPDGGG